MSALSHFQRLQVQFNAVDDNESLNEKERRDASHSHNEVISGHFLREPRTDVIHFLLELALYSSQKHSMALHVETPLIESRPQAWYQVDPSG